MHETRLATWEHDHSFGLDRPQPGERRTLIVALLTAVTMVVEVVAGLHFGSMALLADGLHMASHAAALGLAVFAYVYCRRRASDPGFAFGTGKVNSLGGYTSALLLVGFALYMAVESVSRLIAPVPIAFDGAIAVAFVGLIVNGVSVFILRTRQDSPTHGTPTHQDGPERHAHGHAHGHHHGHGHAHHDHNLRGAYLHVLADALTSLLAIVALISGKYLGAVWMDPLMGIVGACLVSHWAYGLLRDSSRTLLDRQAPGTVRDAVRQSLERIHDTRVVDLHLWSIGPGLLAAEIAVVSHQPREPSVYKDLLSDLGLAHVTVEVHRCPGDPCM
ncbi:MAG: CDF family Co(II)/Ni(II) efflux transporter DmeF [bacterium]|nr:CDF family Co(II)/Ni(II) efflux transporter DmeF [bacterium]